MLTLRQLTPAKHEVCDYRSTVGVLDNFGSDLIFVQGETHRHLTIAELAEVVSLGCELQRERLLERG